MTRLAVSMVILALLLFAVLAPVAPAHAARKWCGGRCIAEVTQTVTVVERGMSR